MHNQTETQGNYSSVNGLTALCAVLLVLLSPDIYPHESHSDVSDDPAALFEHLLYDHGYPLDEVRHFVAAEFDNSEVAADISVFLCAPEPDPACQGSAVWNLWDYFLHYLSQGYSMNQVVDVLAEEDADLTDALLIYWCTPPAGAGCEDAKSEQAPYEQTPSGQSSSEHAGTNTAEQHTPYSQPKSRPENHQLGRQGFLSGSKRDAVNGSIRRGRSSGRVQP